jgi:hypothetical protein
MNLPIGSIWAFPNGTGYCRIMAKIVGKDAYELEDLDPDCAVVGSYQYSADEIIGWNGGSAKPPLMALECECSIETFNF